MEQNNNDYNAPQQQNQYQEPGQYQQAGQYQDPNQYQQAGPQGYQPAPVQLKGSSLLKIASILLIVFGAIGIIVSIIGLVSLVGLSSFFRAYDTDFNLGLLYVAGILGLVGTVLRLVAGIIGLKNHNNKAKAGTCFMWGIIIVAFTVVSSILTVIGGNSFPFLSFIIGLIVPALYIVGAHQNKVG